MSRIRTRSTPRNGRRRRSPGRRRGSGASPGTTRPRPSCAIPAATTGFLGARYRDVLPEGSAARTELGRRINLLDPPDHTRVRGSSGGRSPHAESRRSGVGSTSWRQRLLDDAEAAADRRHYRPAAVARPPAAVACDLPDARRPRYRSWPARRAHGTHRAATRPDDHPRGHDTRPRCQRALRRLCRGTDRRRAARSPATTCCRR